MKYEFDLEVAEEDGMHAMPSSYLTLYLNNFINKTSDLLIKIYYQDKPLFNEGLLEAFNNCKYEPISFIGKQKGDILHFEIETNKKTEDVDCVIKAISYYGLEKVTSPKNL